MSIQTEAAKPHVEVRVKVTFPISTKGPFQAEVAEDTTGGVVLADAKGYFEVQDDSQFTYVLAHDGVEVDPATTVGALAGQAHDVRFTLVKKITQG
jgi:hypothetical protein